MHIAIIGCGICGSYLGRVLSKAGYKVHIFERKLNVGGKACSGLVSQRLWTYFPKNDSIIENEVRYCEIRLPNRKIKLKFEPEMLVLNRNKLDLYSARLCAKAGAKINFKSDVKRVICPKSKRPHIVVNEKSLEFDLVIGCDGANSIVRQSLMLPNPKFRLGLYKLVKRRSNKVIVWPTENGFKWSIPRGELTEIGVLEKPNNAKRIISKPTYGAIIPCGLIVSNHERVALCGDAAGLTKPWSGGGIIWALRSANTLFKHKLDIKSYNKEIKKTFGPSIFYGKFAVYIFKRIKKFIPEQTVIDSDWLW